MDNKICIFSYGSNSISQIRGRVNNLSLKSYPAYIDNYKRIFVGHSKLWNGGVASLAYKRFIRTYGIIVYLDNDELEKLDKYEVNYSKKELDCITNDQVSKKCYAYIANDNYWNSHPSQQYLTAIKVMLNEHYPDTSYIIVAGIIYTDNKIQNISKWIFPKDINNLSLESMFVIVNSKRSEPWRMPTILNNLILKFNSINIFNTYDLKIYINTDTSFERINNLFLEKNHKKISYETYSILRSF